MLEGEEIQKVLDKFTKKVVSESKKNLKKSINGRVKNTSGKLHNSIKGESKVMPNSVSVSFSMVDYGQFQDKGVSGIKRKFNTPFTYRNLAPPTKSLDKWIVKKGLAPKNIKGKFISRLGLKFAIAKHIRDYGIKPSLFFTTPFEKEFKKLPNELIIKFGLDVESLFKHSLKQPIR